MKSIVYDLEESPPLVTIAILTWNRREEVLRAIQSCYDQPYRPFEIVVVDSASCDGTPEAIRNAFPDVRLICLHRNLGCPEGRNVAFANAHGTMIFVLDDDGWLSPETIERCVDVMRSNPEVAVVTCRVVDPVDTSQPNMERFTYLTRVFNGGASMIRRSVLSAAGLYPSDFLRQGEESDLALRILDRGWQIVYHPGAKMFHAPSKINRNPALFMFLASRNELKTIVRLYPWPLIPIFLLQKSLSWLFHGIRRGAAFSVLWGIAVGIASIPRLVSQRHPVSFGTIRLSYSLRRMKARTVI